MPLDVWLLVLHPILVTLPALITLVLLLRSTGLWAGHKYRILLALLAAYAIDAGFALPRILFAHGHVAVSFMLSRFYVFKQQEGMRSRSRGTICPRFAGSLPS